MLATSSFFMPSETSIWQNIFTSLGWRGREYSRISLEKFFPILMRGMFLSSSMLTLLGGYFFHHALQYAGLINSQTESNTGNAVVLGFTCLVIFFLVRCLYVMGKNTTMLSLTQEQLPSKLRRQHENVLIALIQQSVSAETYYRELMKAGLRLRIIDLECMRILQQKEHFSNTFENDHEKTIIQ